METTHEENEERQDELETPHHEDPIQEEDENEGELNEGAEGEPAPEEATSANTEGEHDVPKEEAPVESGEAQEEKKESADGSENDVKDAAEKPESTEDEVFENETKVKHDESDTEVAAHDGTASPTSEKHAVKKRPHRKIHNENMIAEEDIAEETARSPGPPPLEPISQNLDELNNTNATNDFEIVKPTTPDHHHHHHERGSGDEHDHDHEEIIEEEEIKLSREEIIARYHAAMEEKERNQNLNNQLHHKLADYFRRKKPDDAQSQQIFDKTSQDQEQRYLKYLANIEELHKQLEKQQEEFERERYDLKTKCEMKQKMVQEERAKYLQLKKETAMKAVGVHSGKALQMKEIDEYFQKEKLKDQEVVKVRLENIKLKNQVKKKENQLKAKEELGEGLHLIDFEQLKIENQTYNEKIEERNEELMKLKKKINDAVQTLSHVKEKLKFVIMENEKEKDSLTIFDDEVKKKRDILNRMKQSRDSLRLDNNKLKQNSGLLGNTTLLRDFEDCVDENEALLTKIDQLKRKHAELTLNSKGIKQKIMQAKADKN